MSQEFLSSTVVYCSKCQQRTKVFSEAAVKDGIEALCKQDVEEVESGKFLTIVQVECEHCKRKMIVQVDDEESRQLLEKYKIELRKLLAVRSKGKQPNKKQQSVMTKLHERLLSKRKKLLKSKNMVYVYTAFGDKIRLDCEHDWDYLDPDVQKKLTS